MIRVGCVVALSLNMLGFSDNGSDDFIFQSGQHIVEIVEELDSSVGVGEKPVGPSPFVYLDRMENDIVVPKMSLFEHLNFWFNDFANVRSLDDHSTQNTHRVNWIDDLEIVIARFVQKHHLHALASDDR